MLAPAGSIEGTSAPEVGLRAFSLALAPKAILQVEGCGALVRHLHVRLQPGVSSATSDEALSQRQLSSLVIAVRAQTCTVHLFRGHRLCRVIKFLSPVVDIAGVPPNAQCRDVLCVVTCRDGNAYALPTSEILGRGDVQSQATAKAGITEHENGRGAPCMSAPRGADPEVFGIFDDLRLDSKLPLSQDRRTEEEVASGHAVDHASERTTNDAGDDALQGLIMRVRQRWALFSHLGTRTICVCSSDGTYVAAAGMIDRASFYRLESPAGKMCPSVGVIDSVDGFEPTTSCSVWAVDYNDEYASPGAGDTLDGESECFAVDLNLFRELFGTELAVRHKGVPTSAGTKHRSGRPAVLLIGDRAGIVRWSPVPPYAQVTGGVLIDLATPIVAVLPQLNVGTGGAGLLIVGANGTVVSLNAVVPERALASKRLRTQTQGRHSDVDNACDSRGVYDTPSGRARTMGSMSSTNGGAICRRVLKVPFPISVACAAAGFLFHGHAGALFASALPPAGAAEIRRNDRKRGLSGRPSSPSGSDMSRRTYHGAVGEDVHDVVHPVRLPLPCETIAVAGIPVLVEAESTKLSEEVAKTCARTLIVSLSGRGRLMGFMAPRSSEELQEWGLDAAKDGVRVGGSAGTERRVRGQLERLSSLGRLCAIFLTESAQRDREIRTLREAAELLPILVQEGQEGDDGPRGVTNPMGYSATMSADLDEDADFPSEHVGPRDSESLRLRLRVRLQATAAFRSRNFLPAGEDIPGKWFIVTRVQSEEPSCGNSMAGHRWTWSTSAPLPIASLQQGRSWTSTTALALPSAHPTTVTSWIHFRFAESAIEKRSCSGRFGGDNSVCAKLGSSRFDLLDWGVRLASVPRNAKGLRNAAHGRGSCFLGLESSIADVFETGTLTNGQIGMRGASVEQLFASPPAEWGRFRLRVTSRIRGAGALLHMLLPLGRSSSSLLQNGHAPAAPQLFAAETAFRIAGQLVVIRAWDHPAALRKEPKANEQKEEAAQVVDITVSCSCEAMTALIREALLKRLHTLRAGGPQEGPRGSHGTVQREDAVSAFGDEDVARGNSAACVSRQLHSVRAALASASDAIMALCTVRGKKGPSVGSSLEAIVLMRKLRNIYQGLRDQQEKVGGAWV